MGKPIYLRWWAIFIIWIIGTDILVFILKPLFEKNPSWVALPTMGWLLFVIYLIFLSSKYNQKQKIQQAKKRKPSFKLK